MTEDEHPNERLVTPSEDGDGFDRSLVSRRDLLAGSTMLAGLLAYTSDPSEPMNPRGGIARASDDPDEPLIILGPESDPVGYLFQDTAGGIILQDATSGNHFWYNQAQGRWETDAELDVPTLTAENLVDGAGVSHTGELSDLGEVFLSTYDKTVGGGSVTDNNGVVEIRQPGNASAIDETRIYSHIIEFDPSVTRRIRINLTSVTIDDNTNARILAVLSTNIDADQVFNGTEEMLMEVRGDGTIVAAARNNGSGTSSTDSTKSNTFIGNLQWVELSWDGSTVTAKMNDGSETVEVSHSNDYPSGATLTLAIKATDQDAANARNVDYDMDSVVMDQ